MQCVCVSVLCSADMHVVLQVRALPKRAPRAHHAARFLSEKTGKNVSSVDTAPAREQKRVAVAAIAR